LFRYRHEICCYGERLYVLGGGTSFSVYGFDRIPTFDLQTKTWSSSKTRPDENATIDVVGLTVVVQGCGSDPHYFWKLDPDLY
jgi:hypothetical protein